MPKAKTKSASKTSRTRKKKWTEQHFAIRRLLEEELQGLLQYIRSLHYLAVTLLISSTLTFLYSLGVLFQSDHSAVVAFLLIVATSLGVAIASAWVLKPWIAPRFLLPMDMNELELDELKKLFNDPDEYLLLLKTHIQILTDQFLLPKLGRLRNAIALFLFGMSIAILLSIALP